MVKSLFSSTPLRVKFLSAPATLSMTSPLIPGQPLMVKLYVMRKESTTSSRGCDQVRAMEVEEVGEAVSPVGEEGGMAARGRW